MGRRGGRSHERYGMCLALSRRVVTGLDISVPLKSELHSRLLRGVNLPVSVLRSDVVLKVLEQMRKEPPHRSHPNSARRQADLTSALSWAFASDQRPRP